MCNLFPLPFIPSHKGRGEKWWLSPHTKGGERSGGYPLLPRERRVVAVIASHSRDRDLLQLRDVVVSPSHREREENWF
jgi:hypothetical protein